VTRSSLEADTAMEALEELRQQDAVVFLEDVERELGPESDVLLTSQAYWERLSNEIIQVVNNYHRTHPLRLGMPREELKSRLKLSPRLFNAALRKLVAGENLAESGPLVLISGFEVRFTPEQQQAIQSILQRFATSPFSPPSIKEVQAEIGELLYNAMVDLDMLKPVSQEVVFRREDYDHMVQEVRGLLAHAGTITAAQVRDHFNTSRRYTLALLEHLDEVGITVREGDVRRLRQNR
jgi:selenocysteine-specific elongation factor